jgi:hypothetical protein
MLQPAAADRMTILVVIDHDIIVRHFLHSHVFDDLAKNHRLIFVFPEQGYKRVKSEIGAGDVSGAAIRHLTVFVDRLKVWQHLMLADMLRWRAGRHFAAMRRVHRRASKRRVALLYSVFALPGVFQLFRAWSHFQIKRLPYADLEALLDRERPDVIIHPSVLAGVFINDLVPESRRRRIPLIVIMNSWDNPSTKRAMTGQPDWLLVWGPQTQAHAVKFLGMPRDRVLCFGAAQFDVFRNSPRIDREEFCRRNGIDDPGARLLLYAGSSKGTDEFGHLCELDDAIARGDLGNAIVIYRPHPWGDGGKGGDRMLGRAWRHVRIESTMRGYLERVKVGQPGITMPDYRDTHDLLASVDALLSPLSTIIIEGALHGKPVMCFLPDEDDKAGHYSVALPLTHFDELFAEPRFLVVRGNNGLIAGARALLERVGDERFAADLRLATRQFVSEFDQPYGERLVEFVERVAEKTAASTPAGCTT